MYTCNRINMQTKCDVKDCICCPQGVMPQGRLTGNHVSAHFFSNSPRQTISPHKNKIYCALHIAAHITLFCVCRPNRFNGKWNKLSANTKHLYVFRQYRRYMCEQLELYRVLQTHTGQFLLAHSPTRENKMRQQRCAGSIRLVNITVAAARVWNPSFLNEGVSLPTACLAFLFLCLLAIKNLHIHIPDIEQQSMFLCYMLPVLF